MSELERGQDTIDDAPVNSLLEQWSGLPVSERKQAFKDLSRHHAEEIFLRLGPVEQAELLSVITTLEKRSWLRLLAPDDMADLIQELDEDEKETAFVLLDEATKREVSALLAYEEDAAGGLMSSRFVRLRPEMFVDAALRYMRVQARSKVETIYYAYVLDPSQKLLGVVSFRELFCAPSDEKVDRVMRTDIVKVNADMDQEDVSRLFSQYDLMALPVVDEEGRMKGIVTFDDIVTVVEEEATEDIQKLGGLEALDAPYLNTSIFEMLKKRAGWLVILFFGETFTATAMSHYEDDITKAVVLAVFIPLIISSGGNSGSQASTLIIRAMALGQIRLKDWWRVFFREIFSGLMLGLILGGLGLLKIMFWPNSAGLYGEFYSLIALTVGISLVGVVLLGSVTGSMLPFILKRLDLDPATASAPFVATLVDVSGLVIYFTVAGLILSGTML